MHYREVESGPVDANPRPHVAYEWDDDGWQVFIEEVSPSEAGDLAGRLVEDLAGEAGRVTRDGARSDLQGEHVISKPPVCKAQTSLTDGHRLTCELAEGHDGVHFRCVPLGPVEVAPRSCRNYCWHECGFREVSVREGDVTYVEELVT